MASSRHLRRHTTPARRLAGQIERLLLEDTPIIYAYFYDWLTATQKNVTGVYPARPQACSCGTQPELDGFGQD